MTENKKQLGQYYTTNYNKILKGFNFDEYFDEYVNKHMNNSQNITIIEPFCGNKDLLNILSVASRNFLISFGFPYILI